MGKTKIEWCDEVFNPCSGCSPCSVGCEKCFARRFSKRLRGRCGYPQDDPFKVTLHPNRLEQPFHWKKPRRVFVVSMGDLFHGYVPNAYIAAVFGVMAACPQHTFLLLSKRPKRMLEWFKWLHNFEVPGGGFPFNVDTCFKAAVSLGVPEKLKPKSFEWPLSNVALGVSCENQETADERIPLLLKCPAPVHFVSCEPLLSEINLRKYLERGSVCECGMARGTTDGCQPDKGWIRCNTGTRKIRQIIAGSETGPGARPMDLDWARSLRGQCVDTRTPFFFKKDSDGNRELDGRMWDEATERYQERGTREDAYAEPTDRYGDFRGALDCLIADVNIEIPEDPQGNLFEEGEL